MNLAVCILFHEKPEQTIECVASFLPAGCPIVLLDNGSSPAARERLTSWCANFPQIRLLVVPKNLGVSGGRNFLIQNTTEEWLLFVDNDIVMRTSDWLERFARVAVKGGEVFVPRLFNLHEGRHVHYRLIELIDNAARFTPLSGDATNSFPGGAALISRRLFERVGLYDEAIFVGGEDVELALRGILSGEPIRVRLIHDVEMIHDHRPVSNAEDVKALLGRYDKNRIRQSYERIRKKHGINMEDGWEDWVDQQIRKLVPRTPLISEQIDVSLPPVNPLFTGEPESKTWTFHSGVSRIWNGLRTTLRRISSNHSRGIKRAEDGPIGHKKIVFVFGGLELGGAENQGFVLARHLHGKRGVSVKIVGVSGEPGRLAQMCDESGIPWGALRLGRQRNRKEWLSTLLRFAAKIREERPDLLISYTKNANILSGLAWRFIGARGCIWNQADEGLGMGREPINRLAVAMTPSFISNSSGGSAFLQHCYGVPSSKIEVIHNGVALAPPVGERQEWRFRCGVPEEAFAACMVANISRFKDHATLLKAWHKLPALLPEESPPFLVLAGRFDGPEKELIRLAEDLGIIERIRFLGAVSDVSGLLGAVDLFVYSSKSEGLPNAVVEAMASGLPVAGSDIPGIREAVGTRGVEFLAAAGNADALAEAMARLIRDRGLCREYGESLRTRASEEFALPVMLARTLRHLDRYSGDHHHVWTVC